MFNLDQAIAEWRQEMFLAGIKNPEVLAELESHLREDVTQPTPPGLNAQQAFETAVLRIGHAAALRNEFRKVGVFRRATRVALAFVGVPNHYLTSTSINTPSFNLEPRWATYLRSVTFLAPVITLWVLAATYVVPQLKRMTEEPKLQEIWAKYFTNLLWKLNQLNFTVTFTCVHYFIFAAGVVVLALGLLEWRSKQWPRYRRAVLGSGVFLLNLAVMLSLIIMFITAVLEATIAESTLIQHVK